MIEPTFHKKLSDFIYIPSYWHTLLSTLDGIFLAKLYIDNKDDNVHNYYKYEQKPILDMIISLKVPREHTFVWRANHSFTPYPLLRLIRTKQIVCFM